jgi:hypothetical protein
VEPRLTVDEARALWESDKLTDADRMELFLAAQSVN